MLPLRFLKAFSRIKKFILIFIFSIWLLILFVFLDVFFSIKTINIYGLDNFSQINGVENYKKKNIIFLDPKEVIDNILRDNPYIKNVDIKKDYPNTLNIFITILKPIAGIKVNDGYFLLNDSGKIVLKRKQIDNNLPLINYYQKFNYISYNSGDNLDYKDILFSLHFLKKTIELGLNVETVDINGLSMIGLKLSNKRNLIFTTEKDKAVQLYQLENLVRQLKIEGKDYQTLDLRFERPVIKFSN